MHASSPPLPVAATRAPVPSGDIRNRACIFALATSLLAADDGRSTGTSDMVLIAGGTFMMGDIFDEGTPRESPVHRVTLGEFYLGNYEITVEAFRQFVDETGYVTSAENGGAFCLDADTGSFAVVPACNWRNPGFEQDGRHPVTCVSWNDAASYCNWLSRKSGLPPAYDEATGELLDENGAVTRDITKVRGFRLPTEAEWEYAARGGGKTIRFGNGRNVARSDEINFDASSGEHPYAEKGLYRKKTVPVGSFKPNDLGLYDMAGNVWEWCSDFVGIYGNDDQVNPYNGTGVQSRRAARGGRWGGSAQELRISARMGWTADDRCNNIGFRVAKSK
ncbi:MAG: formylglycine-generating enzyme family protein [Planctomycetota bacterium]|jgi:formylglycine-generating enzyme required for sulfatase activity